MNCRRTIAFVTLISFLTITALADPKPLPEQEINALIQRLVSPNVAPDVVVGATYPAGYNHDAQRRARHALMQLHQTGIRAFPYLFDHFDDERYSFTDDAGSADFNWSVGRACSDIVICHLQPYGSVAYRRDPGIRLRPSYSALQPSHLRGGETLVGDTQGKISPRASGRSPGVGYW